MNTFDHILRHDSEDSKDSNGDSLTLIKSDTLWSILYHDSLEVKDRQLDQFFEKAIRSFVCLFLQFRAFV